MWAPCTDQDPSFLGGAIEVNEKGVAMQIAPTGLLIQIRTMG